MYILAAVHFGIMAAYMIDNANLSTSYYWWVCDVICIDGPSVASRLLVVNVRFLRLQGSNSAIDILGIVHRCSSVMASSFGERRCSGLASKSSKQSQFFSYLDQLVRAFI